MTARTKKAPATKRKKTQPATLFDGADWDFETLQRTYEAIEAIALDAAGRVLWEILAETSSATPRVLPRAQRPVVPPHRTQAVVARLRALGYIE